MRILIVGAGPIGCYTGQLLKKIGYEPILLEEHSSVGKPVQCAGIVSSKLIKNIESFITEESITSYINSFIINTPWTDEFSINIPGIACVLNREKFDLDLSKGLEIHFGKRITKIEKKDSVYYISTKQGELFETDILIGADGPDSIVRNYLLANFKGDKNKDYRLKIDYYFGMQYQIKLNDSYPGIVNNSIQVYFDEKTPFFIWIVSENSKSIRIGSVGKTAESTKKSLDDYLERKKITGEFTDVIAGKIALGNIPTYFDNIALVGDAACQVKPLTGGGLSYGLQCVQTLASCIEKNELDKYEQKWKKKFGKEIIFGLKARKYYETMNVKHKKEIFNVFKNNHSFIEKTIDYDNHSTLFFEAFKNKQILIEAGKIITYYLKKGI